VRRRSRVELDLVGHSGFCFEHSKPTGFTCAFMNNKILSGYQSVDQSVSLFYGDEESVGIDFHPYRIPSRIDFLLLFDTYSRTRTFNYSLDVVVVYGDYQWFMKVNGSSSDVYNCSIIYQCTIRSLWFACVCMFSLRSLTCDRDIYLRVLQVECCYLVLAVCLELSI
jgi:hypothetical protein